MTRLERFLAKYKLDAGGFPEREHAVLESLRYREQNLAVKAGSTLGFCGLMIASILVQLAAPTESMIFIARSSPWAIYAKCGLVLLLVSALVSLIAITWGRGRYPSNGTDGALGDLAATMDHKRLMRLVGACLCIAGSACASISLLGTLLQ